MKKLLYIFAVLLLTLFLLTEPWHVDGTCGDTIRVSFKGIKFSYPIKVTDALKTPAKNLSRSRQFMQTDSVGDENITLKLFFGFDSEWEGGLTFDTVKENNIYAVAFELRKDSCKTVEEIAADIRTMYPGDFRSVVRYGNQSYIWERDCLTIFVKSIYLYDKGYSVPEVSFCYGLRASEIDKYAEYTGFINGLPD